MNYEIIEKGGGLFVKAHEQPSRSKNKTQSTHHSQESFVDDDEVLDFHNTVPIDDHSKTQTLPKSYKTRVKNNKEFESSTLTKVYFKILKYSSQGCRNWRGQWAHAPPRFW